MKRNNYIAAGILNLILLMVGFAQNPAPTITPATSPATLETIIAESAKQTASYREEFKNLLADETKTFEKYDKKGELKDKKIVESTLLVYQSPKNPALSSELRNVTKVDGKLLPDSQARSEKFLAELQKTSTAEKELEKLESEGSRYDNTLELNGFTLFEGVALADNLRPFFDFKLTGTENYQGREVYIVEYQQNKRSPFIMLNGKNLDSSNLYLNFRFDVPGDLKKNDVFLRGKLWIDAQTFQLWREERELTVQSSTPLVLLSTTFDYQTSDYGILVPKQINFVSNVLRKNSGQYAAAKDLTVNFDYSKFRKTEVDIKILDDNE